MAETDTVRKSGRKRIPNKKYTIDAIEGLDILNSDSEVEIEIQQQLQESKNDVDFPEDHIDRHEDEESLADDGASDGSPILTPEEEHEDPHSYASPDPEEHPLRDSFKGHNLKSRDYISNLDASPLLEEHPLGDSSKGHKPKSRDYVSNLDANTHSRGMLENLIKNDSERSRVKLFSGLGVEDILHIVRSRDQWAVDPTLPSRKRMRYQVSHTYEKRQMEATVGWDWYYDQGGRELFAKKQKVQVLSLEEGVSYLPKAMYSSLSFLMGPYGRQKVFTLRLSQSLGLEEAWRTASELAEHNLKESESHTSRRLGWMLNVGTRVRCLDWAPNHDGETQYLALAVAKASTSTSAAMPSEAPAFTPSSPSPSNIQIWAFNAADNSIESTRPPELQLVLCTDWGEITQLKWCPVPRVRRNEDTLGKISIGLLAGVWGDGFARVLDVQLEKGQGAITSYCKFHYYESLRVCRIATNSQTTIVKIQSAAFSASSGLLPLADMEQENIRPITTCLTWLSATDLAIGYSNGALGIFNIYPHSLEFSLPNAQSNHSADLGTWSPSDHPAELSSVPEATDGSNSKSPPSCFSRLSEDERGDATNANANANVSPWLFLHLHPTYILSLTTAYPTHPDLLISSSLSGNLRLTSLRAPTTDYVFSLRTRIPPPSLAYCDSLLSVVAAEETSETIRLWGLRSFYSSLACGKMGGPPGPGHGVVDVGKCHSSIAAGGVDGSVLITNPMRKALGRRDAGWQQVVFKHEWVRRPGPGPREGMSRITEGYKGEKVNLKPKETLAESTLYEEETAVTALGWNPNKSGCGGWLAVGWGSGLVRVQDMAV